MPENQLKPRNGGDPTANVLDLVAAEGRRQDDLRGLERMHRREVRELDNKYRDAAFLSESRRLDALLAAQNTAVAIAATRAEGTASALAERVDTAAKTLAAEAGSKEQRGENRQTSQWTVQQVITLIGVGLGILYFILSSTP